MPCPDDYVLPVRRPTASSCFQLHITPDEVRIQPRKYTLIGYVQLVVVILGLFSILQLLFLAPVRGWLPLPGTFAPPTAILYVPTVLGIVVTAGLCIIHYFVHTAAAKFGPILIANRHTGQIQLPAEGVTFAPSQIDHFELITTRRFELVGRDRGLANLKAARLTQANVIVYIDRQRRRFHLTSSPQLMLPCIRSLTQLTNRPALRVTDADLGRVVNRKPIDPNSMLVRFSILISFLNPFA